MPFLTVDMGSLNTDKKTRLQKAVHSKLRDPAVPTYSDVTDTHVRDFIISNLKKLVAREDRYQYLKTLSVEDF